MADFQEFICMGNICRDVELKTVGEHKVVNNSIAINGKRGGKDKTLFLNFVAWNKTAEMMAEHLVRGEKILVVGELTEREWQGRDGDRRTKIELQVNRFSFIGIKKTAKMDENWQPPEVSEEEAARTGIPF